MTRGGCPPRGCRCLRLTSGARSRTTLSDPRNGRGGHAGRSRRHRASARRARRTARVAGTARPRRRRRPPQHRAGAPRQRAAAPGGARHETSARAIRARLRPHEGQGAPRGDRAETCRTRSTRRRSWRNGSPPLLGLGLAAALRAAAVSAGVSGVGRGVRRLGSDARDPAHGVWVLARRARARERRAAGDHRTPGRRARSRSRSSG